MIKEAHTRIDYIFFIPTIVWFTVIGRVDRVILGSFLEKIIVVNVQIVWEYVTDSMVIGIVHHVDIICLHLKSIVISVKLIGMETGW